MSSEEDSDSSVEGENAEGVFIPGGSSSEDEDEMQAHYNELEKLRKTDPDFISHLEEEAPELLGGPEEAEEIGDDWESRSEDDSKDSEDSEEEESGDGMASSHTKEELTMEVLDSMLKQLEREASSLSLKNMLNIVSATAEMIDSTIVREEMSSYAISDQAVFTRVNEALIPKLGGRLDALLENSKRGNPRSCPKWRNYGRSIKHITDDLLVIIEKTGSDGYPSIAEGTEGMLHYFRMSLAVFKKFVTVMIGLWTSDNSETARKVFRNLLASATKGSYIDIVMRGVYIAHISRGAPLSHANAPLQEQRRREIVKLFSHDNQVAYRHCFVYIRQIAVMLRPMSTTTTKELGSILNWRFYESLVVLFEIICELKRAQQMSLLVYPLVQITLGLSSRVKAGQYAPFRLKLVALLIDLAKRRQIYIPMFIPLVDIFTTHIGKIKRTASPGKPIDFRTTLKISKSMVGNFMTQESIHREIIRLLWEGFAVYAAVPAFPELTFPITTILKRELKTHKQYPLAREMNAFLGILKENSEWAKETRKQISQSPAEIKEFDMTSIASTQPPLLSRKHEDVVVRKDKKTSTGKVEEKKEAPGNKQLAKSAPPASRRKRKRKAQPAKKKVVKRPKKAKKEVRQAKDEIVDMKLE